MYLLLGRCLTMTRRGQASALAIRGGRIAAVGEAGELAVRFPGTPQVRVELITPGLHDAHLHPLSWGRSLVELPLAGVVDPREAAARVAARAAALPPGEWITGCGFLFDHHPDGALLDEAAPRNPVFLRSRDLHAAWANAAALRAAGVDARTPDPPGGALLRRADGTLTGYLLEGAAALLATALPPPTAEDLLRGLEDLARRGFTAAHAMDYEGEGALAWAEALAAAGRLPLRLWWAVGAQQWRRCAPGWRGDDLHVAAVKLFVDGALGSRTAWMEAPYPDGTCGLPLAAGEELVRLGQEAAATGYTLALHAIGTRAVREAVGVLQALRPLAPAPLRLEHGQHVASQDLRALAQCGAVVSMQPVHLQQDAPLIRRLLPGREGEAFRFRDLRAVGVTLAFGSDAPVAPPDVAAGLHCALRHPLTPQQSLTWAEAVEAFTAGGARAAGWTDYGALRPGARADLALWEGGRLVGRVWRGEVQWLSAAAPPPGPAAG